MGSLTSDNLSEVEDANTMRERKIVIENPIRLPDSSERVNTNGFLTACILQQE